MSTLGNYQQEAEYIASQLLNEGFVSKSEQTIRMLLSRLPKVTISAVSEEISKLEKLIDKYGILKDSEISKFSKGKNEALLQTLVIAKAKLVPLIPAMIKSYDISEQVKMKQIDEKVSKMKDYSLIGRVIPDSPVTIDQQYIKASIEECNQFVTYTLKLLTLYGKESSIKKEKKTSVTIKNLPVFLFDQNNKLQNMDNEISVTMKYKGILDTLQNNIIPRSLNPYDSDVLWNIFSVFKDPESFYRDCKTNNIVSPKVGISFHQCFPEFYLKFSDIMREDLDKMSNQEQTTMLNSFGLVLDNSTIINLLATAKNIQPQGV